MPTNEQIKQLQTLKTIAEKLNEANDMKTMLEEVMSELLPLISMDTGWIFLVDKDGQYELATDKNLPPALARDTKRPMCEGVCWCLNKYLDGRLEGAVNMIECQRIEEAIENNCGETNGITHHATVPLKVGNERFGLLNVAATNKTHFTDEELALLESVAFQIGAAIKRIKLAENEQSMALITERNRLARDLHDSVNQLLFSIILTARGTREMSKDQEVKEMLSYIQELSQEALHEMKALIWQLRPQGLENGIVSALKNYSNVLGLNVTIEVEGNVDIPAKIEETLWRIGQEALNNCRKHANTKDSFIALKVKDDQVVMKIKDKGCGFHYEPGVALPSLGLLNMKERAEMQGGTFHLESEVGKGSTVRIEIPIKE
ncbi:GAF domain-containing protein [Anaerobacillus alkaliphilus]|uniref:Oxygen sensor histidine kinase NreB n=1 Tax=Anaerobacillus alkaliphilus TaxID=1548597 RepID=A0A4Q0VSA4_9BACI|nr:GAF domain-containing sensor histidine kinase [Anaerobacillus alkaliphilus]RXJ00683.1 GAF domain-containing protein [Anaerobacillus alkaliphilus]